MYIKGYTFRILDKYKASFIFILYNKMVLLQYCAEFIISLTRKVNKHRFPCYLSLDFWYKILL